MIIDIHVHAFPPSIRDHREDYFDDEPAFKLLYDSPKSRLVGAADIVAMMDDTGVDHTVIFGFPWRKADTFRANNDYILESVSRYPDRLSGFCCLDPGNEEAPGEVERCLAAGMAGVGELAFYQGGIDVDAMHVLEPIMDQCRQADLPVMIHTNEPVGHQYPGKTPNTLKQIYRLVTGFPENRIILAHWGGGLFFYRLMKKEVEDALSNVWFDTAASPFLYDSRIYRMAVDLIGKEKILFGTDYPLLKPPRYFNEMQAAGLSNAERAAICGGNARGVLHL